MTKPTAPWSDPSPLCPPQYRAGCKGRSEWQIAKGRATPAYPITRSPQPLHLPPPIWRLAFILLHIRLTYVTASTAACRQLEGPRTVVDLRPFVLYLAFPLWTLPRQLWVPTRRRISPGPHSECSFIFLVLSAATILTASRVPPSKAPLLFNVFSPHL